MADSEKLTALKKAYADIILNTAKEAAARIMVSERKALRYQHELFAAKDEALRMLLRLKQMLHSKVNEAEMTSLSQKKRIDELEAQLGEAEDIVKDLRAELRELQDELEKVTNDQMQLLDEQNSKGETVVPVETLPEDRLNTFGTVISSPPDAQPELVTTSDIKNSISNRTYDINQCCHKDNCYACNSDFASIVMRRKEPELYRNGCTQRIRALERSLLNGNLSLSGKADDVMDELSVREDDEGKDTCIELSDKADNICRVVDNRDKFKVMQEDDNRIQVHGVRPPCRKRKRVTRYNKIIAPLSRKHPDQIVEMCQASDFSYSRSSPYAVNNNAESGEDQMIENNCGKDPGSSLASKSSLDTSKTDTQPGCEEVTRESDEEVIKACTVRKNEKSSLDKMELRRQESEPAENLEVPASNTDLEAVDLSSVSSDVKASDLTEGIPNQPVNNKFLKYTFRRKRKKESLSSPDRDSSLDESTMKRMTGEKQNGSLESQKSTLTTESSRDSRRLAQVARQLISLSEKKWWQ